jgi:hypothetical protein
MNLNTMSLPWYTRPTNGQAFPSNPMNPSIEMAYGKKKKSSHSMNGFEIICLAMNRV